MSDEISRAVISRLRLVCLDMPEAVEEKAWAGIRWCVNRKNFAHVLLISEGWPPDSYRVLAPKKLIGRMAG
jgi:hypothetical protein